MHDLLEKWDRTIDLLESIRSGILSINESVKKPVQNKQMENIHVPFRGTELYLLHKAFIDAGGAMNENYKSLLEKTVDRISNKTQKKFSVQSLCKYSDKVDPESKENVKRFLQKMIRNIDSYE